MCVPIKGQYEQLCNAYVLYTEFGVFCLEDISYPLFAYDLSKWIKSPNTTKKLILKHSTQQLVSFMVSSGLSAR